MTNNELGRRIAVIIGTNEYSKVEKLEFAESDAKEMGEVLLDQKICGFDEVIELINKSKEEVSHRIEKVFKNAKKEDEILIYFSGHGKPSYKFDLCLLFKDTDPESLLSTSLKFDYINECKDQSACNRVVVILDCCYSGTAGMKGDFLQETLSKYSGSGTILLTSTGQLGSNIAKEDKELKHGVFTHYLLKGLKDWVADYDSDGIITVEDLYRYTFNETKAKGLQRPQIKGSYEGEMVLGRNPQKIRDREFEQRKDKLIQSLNSAPSFVLYKSLTILQKIHNNTSALEPSEVKIKPHLESLLNDEIQVEAYIDIVKYQEKLRKQQEEEQKQKESMEREKRGKEEKERLRKQRDEELQRQKEEEERRKEREFLERQQQEEQERKRREGEKARLEREEQKKRRIEEEVREEKEGQESLRKEKEEAEKLEESKRKAQEKVERRKKEQEELLERKQLEDQERKGIKEEDKARREAEEKIRREKAEEKANEEPEKEKFEEARKAQEAKQAVHGPSDSKLPPKMQEGSLRKKNRHFGVVILTLFGIFLVFILFLTLNAYSTVSVIDTDTNNITATMAGFYHSRGFIVSPDGKKGYVTSDSNIYVIDTNTNTVAAIVNVEDDLINDFVISPDGKKIYVTSDPNIYAIDTDTNTVIVRISAGGSANIVTVSPDGKKVYVASEPNIYVIDTRTNEVTATVNVGGWSKGITVSPDGKNIYVTTDSSIYVIDTDTNEVTATVPVGGSPFGVLVSPDGKKIYAASEPNIYIIDTDTNNITATANIEDYSINDFVVSPDGKKIYVASDPHIYVIDTDTNNVIATVNIGGWTDIVTVSPDGKKVYVAKSESDTVSVIDTETNNVIAVADVGNALEGLATSTLTEITVSPDGSKVYVARTVER
ncbi:hypothetical protein EQO05_10715 [Methanosarcina sp. MSH10X1]|uniref:caspase, EACC1-associated type n=1 Tax=Methanosarcina sp. MSH10X1 TaxID=2507075 RepID=UPI000FFCC3BB|nr:DUF5074 domain-containing protein [Methanosarcina sp. MSH10X1]RXA18457.1 hypothetical protein EQO05_10715 [Methanosarcina sp. MSH10X1]